MQHKVHTTVKSYKSRWFSTHRN